MCSALRQIKLGLNEPSLYLICEVNYKFPTSSILNCLNVDYSSFDKNLEQDI